jgi:hypothetical protein
VLADLLPFVLSIILDEALSIKKLLASLPVKAVPPIPTKAL